MPEKEKHSPQEDEKNDKSVSWGEGFPTYENHSKNLACKNPDCNFFGIYDLDRNNKNIVGVKKAPYPNYHGDEYAVIVECPGCFEKFWYHTKKEDAIRREDVQILKRGF